MTEFPYLTFSPMPAMRPVGPKREVELLETLSATWDGGRLLVPVGFVHDGPSIPTRARSLVSYSHLLLRPSVVHDYLYEMKLPDWPRQRCDELFLEGLAVEGVGWLKRNVMWSAVRAGGGYAWNT